MARQQQSSTPFPAPLRTAAAPLMTAASVLRKAPGAGTVGRAAGGVLDKVGAVSPRGRRIAVYTGAGALGVAGVVEWPVAVTGAAVAWLTQPRRGGSGQTETVEKTVGDSTSSAGRETASSGSSGSRSSSGAGAKEPGGKSSSGTKAATGRGKAAGS